MKITKRFLDSLSAGAKDVFHRDSELPGFGVKVSPKRSLSFFAEGRIKKGPTKRITLGKHPLLPLVDARKKAQEMLLIMRDGFDPKELEEEERQQRAKIAATNDAKQITLRTVFEEYQSIRDLKPKTLSDYNNTFDVCLSDWLDKPVPAITRREVEKRFIKIKDGQGKGQAAKCMRILASVLNHAKAYEVDEGVRLITENPCDVLKEKKVDRKLKKRERYLDENEVRLVVDELSHIDHPDYAKQKVRITGPTVADFLTLLLFTGLRRDEGARLEWKDVNFDKDYFTIHDTKNRTDHTVPMSTQVRDMLQGRYDADEKHDQWVFPNRLKTGHLQEPRKQIERIAEITGVKFTCHDLRRTFATLADVYGLDHHSIKRALNHKTQDITDQYVQTRIERMRPVFDAVAEQIVAWTLQEPPESKLSDKDRQSRDRSLQPVELEEE
ncbi:MAG: tyrosine-type recombinase/integrase [Candidatus Marinimicrobia bacterium]|nr:tyrosine-type recombinase/integrase [Candidatus Neomarinimicrobiota bacterium]